MSTQNCDQQITNNTQSIQQLKNLIGNVQTQLTDKPFQGSNSIVETSQKIVDLSSSFDTGIVGLLSSEDLSIITGDPLFNTFSTKDPLVVKVTTAQNLINNKELMRKTVLQSGDDLSEGKGVSDSFAKINKLKAQIESDGNSLSKEYDSNKDLTDCLQKYYYDFVTASLNLVNYVNNPGEFNLPTVSEKNPTSNKLNVLTNAYIAADPIESDSGGLGAMFGDAGGRRRRRRRNKRGGANPGVFDDGYEDRFANSYDVVKQGLNNLETSLYPENALDYNNLVNQITNVQKYFKGNELSKYLETQNAARELEQVRCISIPNFYSDNSDKNKPKNCKVPDNPKFNGQNTLANVSPKIDALSDSLIKNKGLFSSEQLAPYYQSIETLKAFQKGQDAEVLKQRTITQTNWNNKVKELKTTLDTETTKKLEANENEWLGKSKDIAKKQKNNTIFLTNKKNKAIKQLEGQITDSLNLDEEELKELYKSDEDKSGILGVDELKTALSDQKYTVKITQILTDQGYDEPDEDDVQKYINGIIEDLEHFIENAEKADAELVAANNDDEGVNKGVIGTFVVQKQNADNEYNLAKTKALADQAAQIATLNNTYSQDNLNILLSAVEETAKKLQNDSSNTTLQNQLNVMVNQLQVDTGNSTPSSTTSTPPPTQKLVATSLEQHKQMCASGQNHSYDGTTYIDSTSCNLGPQPLAAAAGKKSKKNRNHKKNSKKLRNRKGGKRSQNKKNNKKNSKKR